MTLSTQEALLIPNPYLTLVPQRLFHLGLRLCSIYHFVKNKSLQDQVTDSSYQSLTVHFQEREQGLKAEPGGSDGLQTKLWVSNRVWEAGESLIWTAEKETEAETEDRLCLHVDSRHQDGDDPKGQLSAICSNPGLLHRFYDLELLLLFVTLGEYFKTGYSSKYLQSQTTLGQRYFQFSGPLKVSKSEQMETELRQGFLILLQGTHTPLLSHPL